MPERVSNFQGQSFHKLRRACLRRGALFKDPLFPTSAQSLFYKREPPPGLTWKRPREICKDPRLFVDGISTRDMHQGSLGNCWMVAAISCLASEPSLWKKVIPDHMEQEWNPKHPDLYAGIFHFRFWRLGRWMDVVVDDRLPVSKDGVLLFCRSATPREFWSALLEKAYAKLNGCYEALEGGNTAEALIDFTGGVSEPLSLDRETLSLHSDHRRMFFQTLAKAHECKALITCSIRPAEGETVESVLDCGLVRGHAYGITAVRKVRLGERLLKTGGMSRLFMVRMRNPWGTTDWTGAWSQRSQQWQQLSRAEREKMGLIVRDVGEFWMDFEDFCHYFTDVVVCRLVERALLWPSSHWREVRCYGDWAPAPTTPGSPPSTVLHGNYALTLGKNNAKPGGTKQRGNRKEARLGESQQEGQKGGRCQQDKAVKKVMDDEGGEANGEGEAQVDKRSRCGGCINHRETFLHNPQFMFEVRGKEEEVLICLQQEDRRILRKDGGGENLPIGFEVLKVEVNRCSRVQCVVEQAASSVYMDSRSVTLRATLAPGRYVVLPTTFLPGALGRFLLRLFSHSHIRLSELREDLPSPSVFQCFLPQPTVVTTVHLRRASGLSPPKQTAPDVYAIVRCEDDTIRTRVFKAEGNPEFNLRTIFYRRYPNTHISIEVGALVTDIMSNTGFIRHIRSPPQPSKPVLGWSKFFLCIMPIVQIAIGSVYLHDCPRQHHIPIYLIVVGVFGLVLVLLACLPCAQEPEEGTSNPLSLVCKTWNSLTSFFLFCWFIAGNVWIYSIYEPNYNKNTTNVDPYCNKTVYLFAFWTTTLVYILLGLFLVGGCCVLFCFFLCGRADPDDNV